MGGVSFGRTIIVLATRALQNGIMHLFRKCSLRIFEPSKCSSSWSPCQCSNSTTSCILSVDGTLINHCLILACFSTFSLGAEQGTLVVGLVAFVCFDLTAHGSLSYLVRECSVFSYSAALVRRL